MTILVTGGAGYIGSIVVAELAEAGEKVVVYDNLFQGHRAAVHPKAKLVVGDLADAPLLAKTLAEHRPEAIMHFASYTLVGESMAKPFLYLGDNVTNGLNLLRAATEADVKHFILSSTANLFDDPEQIPISEKERIVPGSPYGESKFIMERFLYWLDKTTDLRYTTLRYFNAAGATWANLCRNGVAGNFAGDVNRFIDTVAPAIAQIILAAGAARLQSPQS